MGIGGRRRNEGSDQALEQVNPQEWDGALRSATAWLSNFGDGGHPQSESNFDSLNKLKDACDFLERSAAMLFALHRSITAVRDAGIDLSLYRSTLEAYEKSEGKIGRVKNQLIERVDRLKNKKVPVFGTRLYSDRAIEGLKKRYTEVILTPGFGSIATSEPAQDEALASEVRIAPEIIAPPSGEAIALVEPPLNALKRERSESKEVRQFWEVYKEVTVAIDKYNALVAEKGTKESLRESLMNVLACIERARQAAEKIKKADKKEGALALVETDRKNGRALLQALQASERVPTPAPGPDLEDGEPRQPEASNLQGAGLEIGEELFGVAPEDGDPFVRALAVADTAQKEYETVRDRRGSTSAEISAAAQAWFAAVQEIGVLASKGSIVIPAEEITKIGVRFHLAERALREANSNALTEDSGEGDQLGAPIAPRDNPPVRIVGDSITRSHPSSAGPRAEELFKKGWNGKNESEFRKIAHELEKAESAYREAIDAESADADSKLRAWRELTTRAFTLADEIKNKTKRELAYKFVEESRSRAFSEARDATPTPQSEPPRRVPPRPEGDTEGLGADDEEPEDLPPQERKRLFSGVLDIGGKFMKRLGQYKVFGKPADEILLGIATGAAVRSVARGILSGTGLGVATAAAAGFLAGGTLSLIKAQKAEKEAYNEFADSFLRGRTLKESKPAEIFARIKELQEALSEEKGKKEKDKKRIEFLSDQLRFAMLFLKKASKTVAKEQKGKWKDTLNDLFDQELGTQESLDKKEAQKQLKLYKDILRANTVLNGKVIWSVFKGAAYGAIGGTIGGWAVEALESGALDQVGSGFLSFLKEHIPGFGGDTVSMPEVNEQVDVNGGGSAPSVETVTEPSAPAVAVEEVASDAEVFPTSLTLEQGQNPWSAVRQLLINQGIENPTNAQIDSIWRPGVENAGINVAGWGETGVPLDTNLDVGYAFQLPPNTEALIAQMKGGQ